MTHAADRTYRHRILKVQLYIQEHLDQDLALDRLAKLAHFSPFHFHRIFKGLIGEGVIEYVRRLRLESAAVALKTTDRPVLQVALDSGYGAHEAFTRAFRQLFGVSPSQFRSGNRQTRLTEEVTIMTTTTQTHEVRIATLPPRRVAFLRHVGPYGTVGPTFQRLMAWAGQHGLFGPSTLVMGICWDDPEVTPPDKIRYDCCITVGDNFTTEGEVSIQTVEGGEYALATHRGPYEKLGALYRWLYGSWLPTSGREPRHAPPFEVYRNSPMNAAPEDLLTDICVPLKAR
jgi:AraC family transcriptional regulator